MNGTLAMVVMLGALGVAGLLLRKQYRYSPVLLVGTALVAALIGGMGPSIRVVVQGMFGYFDHILAVLAGTLLVGILYQGGSLQLLVDKAAAAKNPLKRSYLLLLLVALPGMLTGTALASVFTTGLLVARKLKEEGATNRTSTSFALVGALLGVLLPPINLYTMILSESVYLEFYSGLSLALLAVGLPGFLVYGLLAAKSLGKPAGGEHSGSVIKAICPVIVVLVLTFCHDVLFAYLPFLGYPLILMIGVVLALVLAPSRKNLIVGTTEILGKIAPEIGTAVAFGSFFAVSNMLGIPGSLAVVFYGVNAQVIALVAMVVVVLVGWAVSGPLPLAIGAWASFVITNGLSAGGGMVSMMTVLAVSVGVAVAMILPKTSSASLVLEDQLWAHEEKLDTSGLVATGVILGIAALLVLLGKASQLLIL